MTETLVGRITKAYQQMVANGVFVAVAEIGTVDDLRDSEKLLMTRASQLRRREFAAGRWCSRRALEMAGGPQVSILRGQLHEPLWPPGFGGSITHDGRFAAAAIYRNPAPSVGIDIIDRPLTVDFSDTAKETLSPLDWASLSKIDQSDLAIAEVFSAKEAAIKILSKHIGRFMEFTEVRSRRVAAGIVLSHPEFRGFILSHCHVVDEVMITVASILDKR